MNVWEALVIIAAIAAFCFYCWLVSKSEPEESLYDKMTKRWDKDDQKNRTWYYGPDGNPKQHSTKNEK